MKAILLAAGRSSRLYPLTLEKPKSLLEVGGKTLLEQQLDALVGCNITEAIVVTGYLSDVVENKIETLKSRYPFEFKFIYNPQFAEMNNFYSLWLAREAVADADFLCLYTDLIFHPEILSNAARAEGDIVLMADADLLLQQTMKMILDGDRVLTVGRHVTMEEASATFLGVAKISARGGSLIFEQLEKLVANDEKNAFYTAAVEALIKNGFEVKACFTNRLPWIEVDLPSELAEAEEMFPLATGAF